MSVTTSEHTGEGTGSPVDRETLHAVAKPVPTGEIRTTSATGGQKGAKEAQFALIPPGPLWELAVLYGRGAVKYEPDNWKRGYPWSLSYDALKRHLDLWWSRTEDYDPEMGVKHLINVAWHAFNLAWMMENQPDFDDRPNGVGGVGEKYDGALPTPQWILDRLAEQAAAAQEAVAEEKAA
ncbi:dATP/dGTP diphosphohydrolase domain-containing protein [Nocardioides pakistanensis]